MSVVLKSGSGMGRAAQVARFLLAYRQLLTADPTVQTDPRAMPDPEAFVRDIQALGPAFVKIGQALSVRPDLLPAPYVRALERLQDATDPVPFEAVREVVEAELDARLSAVFPEFDPEPLASASLAQVHAATLRDGRQVVVKVQRPGIAEAIAEDLGALRRLAGAADRWTDEGRRLRLSDWIEEMAETLAEELDYRLEADNLCTFGERLRDQPSLIVPAPLPDLSSGRVLTMERIHGTRISQAIGLRRLEEPLDRLAADLVRAYLDQIFIHGLVHADPHPGNVMFAQGRLALIDLGMVARLGPRSRLALFQLFSAAIDGDGDEVAQQAMRMGECLDVFDEAMWRRRCARLIGRFATRADGEGPGGGALLIELTRVGVACGLRPAAEIALLGRTLFALEGVIRLLDPALPYRQVVREHIQHVLTRQVEHACSLREMRRQLTDLSELSRDLPRQARSVLDVLAANQLQVRIGGLEESRLLENLQKIANRITTGLIAAALVIGAALALRVDAGPRLWGYPGLALTMFVVASLLAAALLVSALGSDRASERARRRTR